MVYIPWSAVRAHGPYRPFGCRYLRVGPVRALCAVAVLALCAVAVLALCVGAPQAASASAFYVREQSASALGNGFAGGTAGADDITYMYYNAAGLTRVQGSAVASVGTLMVSSAKFDDGAASTVQRVPIGGGDGGRDAGGIATVPALYGVWDLGGSAEALGTVRLGLSVTAPFGFETEYTDGWIGRYHALQSRLRVIAIDPVVAVAPIDSLSLSAGVQVQRIDAKLTNAIDFGTLGALNGVPFAQPAQQDGAAKLVGDDWGYGWTAGLLFEPVPGTRVGASYRSAVRHEMRGEARFQLDDAGVGAALGVPAGTTAARARVTLPEIVAVGAYHEFSQAWALMADLTWTRWSRFRTLRATFDDGVLSDDVTEQDWRDTWFVALGATYRPSSDWALRSGIAYDQSPARNRTRTPRTPVNSGVMLAFGASYQPLPTLGMSLGYAHWFIESPRIALQDSAPGNASRGNLSGSSRNAVDTVSFQLTLSF